MRRFPSLAVLTISAFVLAACAIPATPIVSDFNGDSVTIVTSSFADQSSVKATSQAEASRICEKGPKKRAEYASTRTNPQTYEQSHLYLCLN